MDNDVLHQYFEEKTNLPSEQILARSRYLLYKAPNNWTTKQYNRSKILFDQYPDIKKAYELVQGLRNIFNTAKSMETAYTKLAHWYRAGKNQTSRPSTQS